MAKKGFRLAKQDVQFTHINQRLEAHGPNEKVNAVDLSFSVDCENDVLDTFAPGLRDAFYTVPSKDDADLVDKAKANEPVRLRYPELTTQAWTKELTNYNLTFHYGLDGSNDIKLEECTVKSIKLELHDGGTVTLAWKVGAHPTDEQMARLTERLRTQLVSISLERAKLKPVKQKDLLDNEPEKNPVGKRAAANGDDDDDDDSHPGNPARGRQAVH